ncbi:hypothetical protein HJFPF1_08669 [Paramyrothecium foliicola]|nr:hypothetical protein HJFPF1_08669 [Paramyrothecium foliicola]
MSAPRTLTAAEEAALPSVNIHDAATTAYWWTCHTCMHLNKIVDDTCKTCFNGRDMGDVALDGKKNPIGRFVDTDFLVLWPAGTIGQ